MHCGSTQPNFGWAMAHPSPTHSAAPPSRLVPGGIVITQVGWFDDFVRSFFPLVVISRKLTSPIFIKFCTDGRRFFAKFH